MIKSTRRTLSALFIGLVFWGVIFGAGSAAAQTVSGTFKVACIADPKESEIKQRKACLHATPQLSFGDEITLAVEHAPDISFDDTSEPDPAKLVLFLDGKALRGTNAHVGRSQTDEDDVTTTLLTYRVTRNLTTAESRKTWKEVLMATATGAELAVSTGMEDGPAAQSTAVVSFVSLRPGRIVLWFVVAVALAVVFFFMAARTGALRDKDGPVALQPQQRAFSLSRVQIALWTLLTIYAYLYIWFLTGEYNATIPASLVGLMGITLTTFGTAAAIDVSKCQRKDGKSSSDESEVTPQLRTPEDTGLQKGATPAPGATGYESEGLFRDLMTSAQGASLHRLQFGVWTLALAAVFVVTVFRTLAMPDFDATLLGLMGLTSGAYV